MGVSEWGLRQSAQEKGWPTTHSQLWSYVHYGLLQGPVDGLWDESTLAKLLQIRRLSRTIRSLPRRVVYLRSNYIDYPVPTALLRKAMIDMAPSVKAAKRKTRQIEAALRQMFEGIREVCPYCGQSKSLRPERKIVRLWRMPKVEDWPAVLRTKSITNELFERQAALAYYTRSMLAGYGLVIDKRIEPPTIAAKHGLDKRRIETIAVKHAADIPLEEQAVILMVRNLSMLIE